MKALLCLLALVVAPACTTIIGVAEPDASDASRVIKRYRVSP